MFRDYLIYLCQQHCACRIQRRETRARVVVLGRGSTLLPAGLLERSPKISLHQTEDLLVDIVEDIASVQIVMPVAIAGLCGSHFVRRNRQVKKSVDG